MIFGCEGFDKLGFYCIIKWVFGFLWDEGMF